MGIEDRQPRLLTLFDEGANNQFSHIMLLAQQVFGVPIVFIKLLDTQKEWCVSNFDLNTGELLKGISLSIQKSISLNNCFDRPLIIEVSDVRKDAVLSKNPFVVNSPWIRYYSSHIFELQDPQKLGIFCLVDANVRELDSREKDIFYKFGGLIQDSLNNKNIGTKDRLNASEQGGDLGDLDQMLSYYDHCLSLTKLMDKELKKIGLQFKEWRILDHIGKAINVSPVNLCNSLHYSNPLLSVYLNRLEEKDLINREHMQMRDKRMVNLTCTEKGLKIWQSGRELTKSIAMCNLSSHGN